MFRTASYILRAALGPLMTGFVNDLRRPQEAQRRLLRKLIKSLSDTEYGRSYKIRTGDDYDSFAAKLPTVTYDDLIEWIERQQNTEGKVLVSEAVLFYEKTSGSSGAAKFIPYTRSLKASFNRMFLIWLSDLLTNGPRFRTGKVYMSVSPAFRRNQATARGVRIGLDDDTEHLNRWVGHMLKPFLAAPPIVARIQDPDSFKLALATLLLAESGLEAISIWNPSMLEVILSYIKQRRDVIASSLKKGFIVCDGLEFRFKQPAASRLELLEEESISWTRVWPELKLISCWNSAHAAAAAHSLAGKFPDVYLQGKGLLATEAPLTMPLIGASGFAPLPSEVFYEFLDERGRILLLHELQKDGEYEVIMTQKGGLSRYRLGDRVRVAGFYLGSPCLEFAGRSDAVCDLVGEKLNENFVRGCLERVSTQGSFQTLLPMTPERGASYYLLLADSLVEEGAQIEAELESELCQAYHYRNARLLGQLGPVRVRVATGLREAFYDYFVSKGMKWGDIKHCHLIRKTEDATGLIARLGGACRAF
ncbi:MAG: GH3 family domain-containing protein [Blastocatellia bacterium]